MLLCSLVVELFCSPDCVVKTLVVMPGNPSNGHNLGAQTLKSNRKLQIEISRVSESLTMFERGGRPTRTGLPALYVGVVALQKPPCRSNKWIGWNQMIQVVNDFEMVLKGYISAISPSNAMPSKHNISTLTHQRLTLGKLGHGLIQLLQGKVRIEQRHGMALKAAVNASKHNSQVIRTMLSWSTGPGTVHRLMVIPWESFSKLPGSNDFHPLRECERPMLALRLSGSWYMVFCCLSVRASHCCSLAAFCSWQTLIPPMTPWNWISQALCTLTPLTYRRTWSPSPRFRFLDPSAISSGGLSRWCSWHSLSANLTISSFWKIVSLRAGFGRSCRAKKIATENAITTCETKFAQNNYSMSGESRLLAPGFVLFSYLPGSLHHVPHSVDKVPLGELAIFFFNFSHTRFHGFLSALHPAYLRVSQLLQLCLRTFQCPLRLVKLFLCLLQQKKHVFHVFCGRKLLGHAFRVRSLRICVLGHIPSKHLEKVRPNELMIRWHFHLDRQSSCRNILHGRKLWQKKQLLAECLYLINPRLSFRNLSVRALHAVLKFVLFSLSCSKRASRWVVDL